MLRTFLLTLGLAFLFACSRPVAIFTYSGEKKVPSTIQFENTSKEAESFLWNFGDGNTSDEVSPAHEYKSSGNYTVELMAIKGDKKRASTQQVILDAPDECLIEIETPYGSMMLQLYDSTPKHQDNFTKLVEQGFYDSLLFHRVISNFMIQGGDPKSKNAAPNARLGSGGPGYLVDAEFQDSLIHIKGALAAARTNNPQKRSSGSQFYIVHGQLLTDQMLDQIEAQKGFRYTKAQREAYKELGGTPFLDRDYTVFGRVIKGLDVIDKIAAVQTKPGDRPMENVWMKIRWIH